MSVHDITIITTAHFTSSAEKFRDELRGFQGVIDTTPGIDEWTGSKVNYFHVGEWYFSASFSQSAAIPLHYNKNLSSYWNFDTTGSGENELIDETGTYSGSFGSQTFLNSNGLHGNAVNFDGTGDYITITPSLTYADGDNFTFTCWFNLAGAGGGSYSRIVKSLYREERMSIIQFVNSNSKLRIRRDEDENEVDIGYDLSSMAGEWHFLTVVRNVGGYSASIDANSLTPIISVGDGLVGTSGLVEYELISATGPQSMSGSLDSLRFYDRQLSQKEITQIYDLQGDSATNPSHIYQVQLGDGRGNKIAAIYNVDRTTMLVSPNSEITSSVKTRRNVTSAHSPAADPGPSA